MRVLGPRLDEDQWESEGPLRAANLVREPGVRCRLVHVAAHSATLAGRDPTHGRRLLYVLSGQATVTNGEYYEKVGPGSKVILMQGETPGFQTGPEDLKLLEFAWTMQASADDEPAVAEPSPPRSGVYLEI